MNNKAKSYGYLEGWLSVAVNTVLFSLKYWVGCKFGSVAMIADAWHTISDSLTSIVLLFGFWVSAKEADRKHPFGHGRAEFIGTVVIGVLLGVVGLRFLFESIKRLYSYKAATFGNLAIFIFLASVFIKEGLAQFALWAGKKTGSKSLTADGWHHRSDAVASGIIVIGTLLGKHFWWLDGVLGILVSFLILYATYDILRSVGSALLGETPDQTLENSIKQVIQETSPLVSGFHHLHMHQYGDHVELTFHIRLPDTMGLQEAHSIVTNIEQAIKNRLHIEATIHLEPANKKK